MGLLGRVDQQEEESECSRCHGGLLDVQPVNECEQLVERRRVGFSMTAGTRRNSELFDDLEGLLSFEPLDYATECGRQPADIFVKREIFRPW
jgi:hypothetical protein